MVTPFTAIIEDFDEELLALRVLVRASADSKIGGPRVRVAGANAAVLLLATTFEEFVRQIARAFAKAVVEACPSYDKLPSGLAALAWKRTLQAIASIELDPKTQNFSREGVFADVQTRFSIVYEFCKGDLSQDIYGELIHNENNMRPNQLNALFKLSGLRNVCAVVSAYPALMDLVNETEATKAGGRVIERMNDFFDRRNKVAHSINALQSSGPSQIFEDIEFLNVFSHGLLVTVEGHVRERSIGT